MFANRSLLTALFVCGLLFDPACAIADDQRPNIVLVMADDLGLGDISPTHANCKIKTPNLQRLAESRWSSRPPDEEIPSMAKNSRKSREFPDPRMILYESP